MIHMGIDHDWPETPGPPCCMGSAVYGPGRCTCWKPVYDLEQELPKTDLQAKVRTTMCEDCAYRPNSPERQGDPDAAGDEELLEDLVCNGTPFWCHQGIRRPLRWVHPSGMVVEASRLSYEPPQVENRPYKADGTPADMCGGWAQKRWKLLTQEAKEEGQ